jgi:hypothetical protein
MACATTCTRITLSIDETGTIIAYEGKVTKIDIPDQINGIPVTAKWSMKQYLKIYPIYWHSK